MADILTKKQRSKAMAKVRSGDTKPEWILRCGLHRLGFRYRLRNRRLPGRPDLAFAKFRSVVFVHGCYWHRHPGCKDASMPKSNMEFWEKKFTENVKRDRKTKRELERRGWRVMVVWECELVRHTVETIRRVANWLKEETGCDEVHGCNDYFVSRSELLAIAEEKVRYRLNSYNEVSESPDSGAAEEQKPCKHNALP